MIVKLTGWTLDVIDQMSIRDVNDLREVWAQAEKAEKKKS